MPSQQDPRSGLYHGWSTGEAGWGEQMSANLRRIGRVLTHLSVLDRDISDPSTLTPADGDAYIIASGATGDWSGRDGHIAVWDAGAAGWAIYAPRTGWLCYIEDEQVLSVYRDGAWSAGIPNVVRSDTYLQTWIQGLQLVWVSGSALTITTGSAWIPSLGRVYQVASDIELTGLSFSANTWYHVYLYDNSGTPAAELSTTEPAAPYAGTARTKTGDTSRRYLGSVRSNGDATPIMFNFLHSGQFIKYRNPQDSAPFRLLSAGTATAETVVSASAVVPVTARIASIRVVNLADVPMRTGTSDDSASGPPIAGIVGVAPGAQAFLDHPLDSSQAMTYWMVSEPGSGGAYIDVYGYVLER